jgi:hypothetical protein
MVASYGNEVLGQMPTSLLIYVDGNNDKSWTFERAPEEYRQELVD